MKKQLSVISCQLSVKKLPGCCFFFILFFTFHFSLFTPAFAGSVNDTVDEMQKKFSKVSGITGKFSQTSYIKDLEQTQKYSGAFHIKKPSRMMWEYDKPRDEKVLIRDTDTWIYKRSENQVIKTRFSKDAYSQVPIALLESFENMKRDFHITMPGENALNLVPKNKTGFVKMIVLERAEGDFPIKMFTLIDTYENVIMIELKDLKINPGLEDSFFKFEMPPGAEVFDMTR